MLTVYGATGYTGRLVVELLSSRGVPLRLAGRNSEKLHALRDAIAARGRPAPDLAVAALEDRSALETLAKRSRVILHCAGPFSDFGPPMIEACLRGGAHYLDITGEARFMAATALRDGEAKKANIALVNAVGFDVVPSDLCVHLAASALGEGGAPEAIDVALALAGRDERPGSSLFAPAAVFDAFKSGGPASGGTLRSFAKVVGQPSLRFEDGRFVEEPIAATKRRFDFPGAGPSLAFNAPIGDVATAARTCGASRVRAYLKVPSPIARALRIALPAAGAVYRSPIGVLVNSAAGAFASKLDGPNEEARQRAHFSIVAEARRGTSLARATLTGRDGYGVTAECAAAIAVAMMDAGYDRAGALTPMQALDPATWRALLEQLGCAIAVSA